MKDEILSYREMCNRIHVNTIQKGMNFHLKKDLSVILMSVRPGAPYSDEMDHRRNVLIYEGHNVPKSRSIPDPKKVDQPRLTDKGTLTENGKFVKAVENQKAGLIQSERIIVFEKLNSGVWCEKGLFLLTDYKFQNSDGRNVFKFILTPIDESVEISEGRDEDEHSRLIPTQIKVAVYRRDKGKCVLCGSTKNLHYDHDFPFSKGGSSITEKNIRILCAKCNLTKHDKIE